MRGNDIEFVFLEKALESYVVDELKTLAGLFDNKPPTRKAELIALILDRMKGSALKDTWNRLDSLQKKCVSEVVHGPNSFFNSDRFLAKYGKLPDLGIKSWGRRSRASLLSCFLINNEMSLDLKKELKLFVPPPVSSKIETVLKPPEIFRLQRQEKDIPVVYRETDREALHDLIAVLRLVDTGKITVSDKTFRPSQGSMNKIDSVLYGSDFNLSVESGDYHWQEPGPVKVFAWPLIVQAANLANLSGKKLQLTPAGRKAVTSPPQETIKRAYQRWLKTKIIDEYNRVDVVKGQKGKGKRFMTAVAGRRMVIDEALRECPSQMWICVDEFCRYMVSAGHDFEVTRDPWRLYVSDVQYGSLGYDGFHDWMILQGRYVMAFLLEYVATLGLIDVAYISPYRARRDYRNIWGTDDYEYFSRYDGFLYFRINSLGEYCLGMEKQYIPATPTIEEPAIRVLPNMEIAAVKTDSLPPSDRLFLEKFTVKASEMVWSLKPATVLDAIEAGHTVEEMVDFLKSRNKAPLPKTIETFFMDISGRVDRLENRGPAYLIEASDVETAHLIARDSKLKNCCLLAGKKHMVVYGDQVKLFKRGLKELGYTVPGLGEL